MYIAFDLLKRMTIKSEWAWHEYANFYVVCWSITKERMRLNKIEGTCFNIGSPIIFSWVCGCAAALQRKGFVSSAIVTASVDVINLDHLANTKWQRLHLVSYCSHSGNTNSLSHNRGSPRRRILRGLASSRRKRRRIDKSKINCSI